MQYRDLADLIRPKAANIFVCLVIIALIWSGVMELGLDAPMKTPEGSLVMGYSPLAYLLHEHLFDFSSGVGIGVSLLFMVVIATEMVWMNEIYSFIPLRSIMPAFFFIVITSLVFRPHLLYVGFFVAMLFAFAMFACFRLCEEGASNASLVTFNIGMLFGLSLCFSLSTAIFVLPLLWITYQARTLGLRTFIAFLLGLFVPILYTVIFLVATDNLFYLEHYIDSWRLGSGAMWQMMSDSTWIYLLSTAVITVFVMVRVMLFSDHQSIRSREETMFICFSFVLSLAVIAMSPTDVYLTLPLSVMYASFLLGQSFSMEYSLLNKIVFGIWALLSVAYLVFPNYNF